MCHRLVKFWGTYSPRTLWSSGFLSRNSRISIKLWMYLSKPQGHNVYRCKQDTKRYKQTIEHNEILRSSIRCSKIVFFLDLYFGQTRGNKTLLKNRVTWLSEKLGESSGPRASLPHSRASWKEINCDSSATAEKRTDLLEVNKHLSCWWIK